MKQDQINTLSYAKAKEDLIVQISKMYYLAQNTEEQIGIIKDNIKRLEELRDITQARCWQCRAISVPTPIAFLSWLSTVL